MTTTNAGDARAYERLNAVLAAHRGDREAWLRVGTLLRLRRQMLNPDWSNAHVFAETQEINYKLVGDLEKANRKPAGNYTLETVVRKIAPAYQVTWLSIADALEGGDLVPLPGTLGAGDRPRLRAAADPAYPGQPATENPGPPPAADAVLPPAMVADAQPFAAAINRALRRWTADYARVHPDVDVDRIPAPPGEALFPDGSRDAASWNLHRDDLTVDELVWLIAALQARAAAARERDTSVGLSGTS